MVHLNSGLSPFSTPASSRQLSVFTPTPRSSEDGERTPSLRSSEDGILTPSECSSEDNDSCRPTDQRGEQINRKLERLAAQNEELSKQIKDVKKERKEERKVNKRAKAHMALITEALRLATAVLTPLPEGSLARLAVMVAGTYMVIKKKTVESPPAPTLLPAPTLPLALNLVPTPMLSPAPILSPAPPLGTVQSCLPLMEAATLASFQDTEYSLKKYVRQSSSLRPRSDTVQSPISFEEVSSGIAPMWPLTRGNRHGPSLYAPGVFDDARGGAASYRESRASTFDDMYPEDLNRWIEKFDQAKLELRCMNDLYEECGGDKAAEEFLRQDGEALQDAAAYEEAFKAYIKAYTHKMSQDEAEEQAILKGLWEAQHGTEDKTHDTSQKPSKKPSRAQMMERQKKTDAELQTVTAMHNNLCAKVLALEAEINAFREKERIIELKREENLKAAKNSVSEKNDFKGDPYVKKKRSYTPAEIKHIQELQDDQVTQDWIERLVADAAGDRGKEVESLAIDGGDWVEVSDA
ncbi:hypothetical protein D6C92_10113 [Aureobasidium pullulans]|nr:hypothetical protein D6C92_10113 [Aureobasidium pullulans]